MARQDIRAGRAFVELTLKGKEKLLQGLQHASARLRAFGGMVAGIGARMTAVGGTVMAPLMAAARSFATTGDQFEKMAARTGATSEALSELAHAAGQSGSTIEDVESGIRRMQKSLAEAREGSKSAADAFERLGLSAADLSDLSPDEQFELIAESISRIQDPAKRAASVMELMGKSATKLLPLMTNGAEGIRELRREARELGVSVSTEDAKAAAALGDAWARVTTAMKGAWLAVGSALAPMLTKLADVVTGLAVGLGRLIRENSQVIVTIAKVAGGVTAAGVAIFALGKAIAMAGSAFGLLAPLIGALLSPMGAVIGLIAAGVGTWAAFTKQGQTAAKSIGSLMADVAESVTSTLRDVHETGVATWQGVVDAVAAGDLALAAQVAWAGLKVIWHRGTQDLHRLWLEAKFLALATWQELTTGIAKFFVSAWANIRSGWVHTISAIKSIWTSFTTFIANSWQRVVQSVGNLLIAAAEKTGIVSGDTAEAWRENLNEPIERDIAARDAEAQSRQAEISRDRESDLARIREEEKGTRDILDSDKQRALESLATQQSTDLAAKERALAEAREALTRLREQAKGAAENTAAAKRQKEALEAMDSLDGLSAGAGGDRAFGTFSAAAALAAGGVPMQRQTLQKLEAIAKNTEESARASKATALTFTA
jgi:hypothetical protein